MEQLLASDTQHVWLVHVTDSASFGSAHIPGSLSCPPFDTLVQLGAENALVLYGEDEHSREAPDLLRRLLDVSIDVYWFAGGLSAWAAAGNQVEPAGWPINETSG